ncbi:RNA polymerase sigma-54 factor 1 [compost metagenome]
MSDQAITELLKKEGLELSRRTVAKYREELKYHTSRRRKRFYIELKSVVFILDNHSGFFA